MYHKIKIIIKNYTQKNSPNAIKNSFMPFWGLFVQKKCKYAISDLKNGRHVPRSKSFEVKFADKIPLPSFVGITILDWEKSAKM